MKQGKVYVDMSTSTRGLARRIAEACEAVGARALDSPVTQAGVYATVGGDKEAFDRCRSLFETISDHVYYVGEAGQGQVAKLVRQYVGFTSFITMAEALTIAANAGADTPFIASFINATTRGGVFNERSWASVFDRDFGEPGMAVNTLDIVSKDVELAVELAREVGGIAGDRGSRLRRAQAWPGPGLGWAAILFSRSNSREDGARGVSGIGDAPRDGDHALADSDTGVAAATNAGAAKRRSGPLANQDRCGRRERRRKSPPPFFKALLVFYGIHHVVDEDLVLRPHQRLVIGRLKELRRDPDAALIIRGNFGLALRTDPDQLTDWKLSQVHKPAWSRRRGWRLLPLRWLLLCHVVPPLLRVVCVSLGTRFF